MKPGPKKQWPERLTSQFSEGTTGRLEAIAEGMKTTVSVLIRQAVDEYLERHDKSTATNTKSLEVPTETLRLVDEEGNLRIFQVLREPLNEL